MMQARPSEFHFWPESQQMDCSPRLSRAEVEAYSRNEIRSRRNKRPSWGRRALRVRTTKMKFQLSSHAEWELQRRGISKEMVEAVLDGPEQRVPDESHAGRWIYQSRMWFEDGKLYLLRVVATGEEPPTVITAYRTSKIEKYWRAE